MTPIQILQAEAWDQGYWASQRDFTDSCYTDNPHRHPPHVHTFKLTTNQSAVALVECSCGAKRVV